MKTQIKVGTWHICIGATGRGVRHKVLMIADGEITTWSEPMNGELGGWSWNGPAEAFREEFQPC